jgi:hypothetical protein
MSVIAEATVVGLSVLVAWALLAVALNAWTQPVLLFVLLLTFLVAGGGMLLAGESA